MIFNWKNSPLLIMVMVLGFGVAFGQVPRSNHVIVVMEENHSYEDVFNGSSMPWLTSIAKQYASATYSYANAHYSIPNYMWLTAGQAVTFHDNTTAKFSVDNIVRYLLVGGRTWKEYAESLPYVGYTGYNAGYYVERHNPFAYFTDVAYSSEKYNIVRYLLVGGRTWKEYAESLPYVGYTGYNAGYYVERHNPFAYFTDVAYSSEKYNIVPFTHFAEDMNGHRLPNFAFITPNVMHDAHNGTLSEADQWLKTYIAPVLKTPAFQPGGDGVLIITFDESHDWDCRPNPSCGSLPGNVGGGRVATVMIGPNVKHGYRSTTPYMEQNVLRTALELLGISGGPGASSRARAMSDMFR